MSQASYLYPPSQRSRISRGRTLARRGKFSKSLPVVKGRVSVAPLVKSMNAIANRSFKRNCEKKLHVLNVDTTVLLAGSFFDITAVGQGDTYYQRDGAQMQVQDIRITFQMKPDATAELQPVRLMLVRWTEDSAIAAPTTTDIFEDTTNEVWLSPYKFESRKYQVLYDKFFTLNLSGDSGITIFDQMLTKNLSTRVGFNGAANTGVNHLYLVLIGDAVTDGPDCVGHVAVRFIDV